MASIGRRERSSGLCSDLGEIQAGIELTREQDAAKAAEIERWAGAVAASDILRDAPDAFGGQILGGKGGAIKLPVPCVNFRSVQMTTRPQAVSTLLQETERVIVTEWRFSRGAQTGWHRHGHDYVVVCLTAGKLLAETSAGEVMSELSVGQAYARPMGVEHNIVNAGDGDFAFVEVELK
jgi:quercetin dioxygenase-like cupin family protein